MSSPTRTRIFCTFCDLYHALPQHIQPTEEPFVKPTKETKPAPGGRTRPDPVPIVGSVVTKHQGRGIVPRRNRKSRRLALPF